MLKNSKKNIRFLEIGPGIDRIKGFETMNIIDSEIVDYIVDVLLHYTKFKADGSLDLRQYLDNVFIEIVDIYGFIITYVPIIEILSNNYKSLTKLEIKIFNKLQFIFIEYIM